MRGVSKALILATGHAVGTADDLDWAALARTGQPIVVYMGLAAIAEIAAALIARRPAPATPAAVIASATTPTSGSWSPTSAASPAAVARRRHPAAGADRHRRDRRAARGAAGARPRRGAGVTARALIVGAARSGSGKTSVSIGLMRALRRRGLAVRGAKSGPDYIDPGFHAAATGAPGVNLDSWAMPPELLDRLAAEQADGADVLVIESAMGLFDGIAAAPGRSGAAADLARRYGIPVLLVLDVSGQSQTAAAIARGFAGHDPAVRIAGRDPEPGRERAARAAGARGDRRRSACRWSARCTRDPDMALPERHLGLVQAARARGARGLHRAAGRRDGSGRSTSTRSSALAAPARRRAGRRRRPRCRRPASASPSPRTPPSASSIRTSRGTGGRAGAELRAVLAAGRRGAGPSAATPAGCPAAIPSCTPAGSPPRRGFRDGLRRFAADRPVHGECGGFMVLGRGARGRRRRHAPDARAARSRHQLRAARRMNLGYRQARLLADAPIGRAGQSVRGHEFHYSRLVEPGRDAPLAELFDGQGKPLGPSGARRGRVTGTFFHAIAAELMASAASSRSSASAPATPST